MPVQNMATISSMTEHMENVPDSDVKCRPQIPSTVLWLTGNTI